MHNLDHIYGSSSAEAVGRGSHRLLKTWHPPLAAFTAIVAAPFGNTTMHAGA